MTAALLDDLVAYFRRFVVLSEYQLTAISVWAAHTYVFDRAEMTPYLIITSAEKRSGKTHLMRALKQVVRKPIMAANITEAALYRSIHEWHPTMLIDEMDTVFGMRTREPSERQEAIRSTLNAGFEREGSVIRCLPPTHKPEHYNVFCPKALAAIGHLPDTIRDRGLVVRMKRRTRSEPIEKMRIRVLRDTAATLRVRLEAWAADIALAEPAMPDDLDDRAQDAYELLVAIADVAGGEWPERTRNALVLMRAEDQGEGHESTGMLLLRDLTVFADRLSGMERIATKDLLALLYEEGECPWSEWWGEMTGKKAPRRLALSLSEFGVKPERWRVGEERFRGYKVEGVLEALARYMGVEHGTLGPLAQPSGNEVGQHGPEEGRLSRVESADLQGKARVPVLDADLPGWVVSEGASELLQSPVSEWEW